MNLFDYVEKYGNLSFEDKEFNEVDNLVLCALSYANFSNTCAMDGTYSLKEIGKDYLSKNKYEDVKRLGIPQEDAYRLLEIVIEGKRYNRLKIKDYVYDINKDMQFCALTFLISDNLQYICFEGTDEVLSGWKEDGEMACLFPIPSQVEAIKYINRNVKLFGPKTIIGGHSKGGNLALVSAMYMSKIKKHKIIKIYNNDGPGLREKEFNSKEYKKAKEKLVHIVPFCSVVGVMLKSDVFKVVKSEKSNILGHDVTTWIIDDDELVEGEMSLKSQRLRKSLDLWVSKYTDEQKKKFIHEIFKALEEADIKTLVHLSNIKNIIKVIHNINGIDKDTKKMLFDLISFNFINMNGLSKDFIGDEFERFSQNVE